MSSFGQKVLNITCILFHVPVCHSTSVSSFKSALKTFLFLVIYILLCNDKMCIALIYL